MEFYKFFNQTDSIFKSILDIMQLKRDPEEIEAVYNILLTINKILDFYIEREDDTLKVIVAYFPLCNSFTQELCEEFIVLKLGLFSDSLIKNTISRQLQPLNYVIPEDIKTHKQTSLYKENYRIEKQFGTILDNVMASPISYGNSVIYSEYLTNNFNDYKISNRRYSNKTANKYWYLGKVINDFNSFIRGVSNNCIFLTPQKSEEFYDLIIEKSNINLQNIIAFPQKSADGFYSKFCMETFQKPYLEDFVNAGLGLRNVFFFSFSKKPYKLRRLFDFKYKIKENIFVEEESLDFISFNYEESLYLNKKLDSNSKNHINKIDLGKYLDELQSDYEMLFDDITSGLDSDIARRNEISLCIDNSIINTCKEKLIDETESDEHILTEILKINSRLWNNHVETKLRHFVYNNDVFIITCNDINKIIKDKLKTYLYNKHQAKHIKFGNFSDLRGRLIKDRYLNKIPYNKILILSLRNDYTDSIFHKYPNSFDPYCLNPNQSILEINNYFFMRSHYEWGYYNYNKALKKILKSNFRLKEMKTEVKEIIRPIKSLPVDTNDEEMDRNSTKSQVIEVYFDNNEVKSFFLSEIMLFKKGSHTGVASISDLSDRFDFNSDIYLQPLSPLIKSVYKDFIDSAIDTDKKNEILFKENPIYGLNRQEIESELQLWKILLINKIKRSSEREVYEEIMSFFNEREKISYFSFLKWTTLDYGIPRSRKMQRFLIEKYLDIKPPYINLIRRIKERSKSNTENINLKIRHFLSIALIHDMDYTYNVIDSELKDLLGITSMADINTIISTISDKINFDKVIDIKK